MSDIKVETWPDVYILPETKKKLDLYIDIANGEISGFGDVSITAGKNLVIEDVFILEQESSVASTEINPKEIIEQIKKCLESGRELAKIRLWWHSHSNMGVYWSKTDDDTSSECFNTAPWFVSLVGNKKGEYRVRLDIHSNGGSEFDISLDNLPLQVWEPIDEELYKTIKEEVTSKVSSPKFATYNGGLNYADTVYCVEINCYTRIPKDTPEGKCWQHRTENASAIARERAEITLALSGDEDDYKSYEYADLLDAEEAETFAVIKAFGPTMQNGVDIDYDGTYVYEYDKNGVRIAKYRVEDNPQLLQFVTDEVERIIDVDEKMSEVEAEWAERFEPIRCRRKNV